jgi:hypothetical protein
MPGVAGEVKVIFVAQTASYSASVEKMRKETQVVPQEFVKASSATRHAMQEARGSVMVLGEEIGIHLPLHVQKFVAGLPGVASAMSAVFSAVAVIAIGVAIAEAAKKVYEFVQKNEEAARKNVAAWKVISEPLSSMNRELDLSNDKLDDVIGKLQGGSSGGFKTMLDEVAASALKLSSQLDKDSEKMQDLIEKGQVSASASLWSSVFGHGAAPTEDIAKSVQGFRGQIDTLNADYGDVEQRAKDAGDVKNYNDTRQSHLVRLETVYAEMDKYLSKQLRNYQNAAAIDVSGPDRSKAIAMLSGAAQLSQGEQSALGRGYRGEQRTQTAFGLREREAELKGDGTGGAAAADKIADPHNRAFEGYSAANAVLRKEIRDMIAARIVDNASVAQLAADEALKSMTALNLSSYGMFATKQRANVVGEFSQQSSQPTAKAASALDDFTARLRATAEQATNLGEVLSNFTIQSLGSFNQTLMQFMTTPGSMRRNTHPWRNMGAGIAESAGTSSLQFAEGSIMKLLIGKDPTAKLGSMNNPMYVRMADEMVSGAAGGIGGIAGMLLKNLLAPTGAAASVGAGSAFMAGGVQGFATGGMVPSNMPAIVGERGPEMFIPASAGRIVPNDKAFGAPVVHQYFQTDARGTDSAGVEATMHRVVQSYAPVFRDLAVNAVKADGRRRPMSRNS